MTQAKGEERESLLQERAERLGEVDEMRENIQTQRLLRRARRYYIVPPARPPSSDHENESWSYGWLTDTWYLTPAAIAALRRQIDEAKKLRREAWEAWAKILPPVLTALAALVSVLVSLILAWKQ